jgi:hypothetical protein
MTGIEQIAWLESSFRTQNRNNRGAADSDSGVAVQFFSARPASCTEPPAGAERSLGPALIRFRF